MARAGLVGGGRLRYCSCRRAAAAFCAANVVIAFLVLRSLYSPSAADSLSSVLSPGGREEKYEEEQINLVQDSIRIREAAQPIELVKAVRKLVKNLAKEKKLRRQQLPLELRLQVADEILKRMSSVQDSSNMTQQREAVELWRAEKLQDVKRAIQNVSELGISTQNAKMLKKALESNWQELMENIGLWMPVDVVNTEHNDKPENEPDEEIIPGPPLPLECHAQLHTDYDGSAVRWGLTHHKESAAECCQACLDQAKTAKPGEMKCNIWVYCPSEFGCYSPDIYEHKHQECWLKWAENPRLNFKDKFSESYRDSHPTAPVVVPWMSGVTS